LTANTIELATIGVIVSLFSSTLEDTFESKIKRKIKKEMIFE
jgi:hypothetical protein